ncbi:MAG TPA: helix-turn-helix transcriptional regulator [Glycomyces sp.]|nr:helix-turn-helix transcriptional regulator [Glycomyces sp.]
MSSLRRSRMELGKFLAVRRSQIAPEAVGLQSGGRRRTPGLRREEVAMLSGVGLSWYTWIEQGRAKNVSAEILTAIAEALLLDDAQRSYIMELAGKPAAAPAPSPLPDDLPVAENVVEHWQPNPAYVLDGLWNVISANKSARQLLHLAPGTSNYLENFFCSPCVRTSHLDWERQAAATVARFRIQSGPAAEDPELNALIERITARSPEFKRLWEDFILREDSCTVQNLVHPHLGDLAFTRTTLAFTCQTGLTLNLLMPALDSHTQDKLGELDGARGYRRPFAASRTKEGAGSR